MSEENARIAREARLKRFEEQKSSYADVMAAAAGGWRPGDGNGGDDDGGDDDGGGVGAPGRDGSAVASEGLRRRGGNQGH